MKLQNKLYFFSTATIVATTFSAIFAGLMIIDQIVYQLNWRQLSLDARSFLRQIEEARDVLQDAGLADIETYRDSARNEIVAKMKAYRLGDTGRVVLMDSEGVCFYPENCPFDKDTKGKIIAGQSGFLEFTDKESGNKYICAFDTAGWGWKVTVLISKGEIFKKRTEYFIVVLSIGLVILCFALWIAYYFAGKLSSQISRLLHGVQQVERGNLSGKIEMNPLSDEFRQLRDGINMMTENLRKREMERERAEEDASRHQKLESISILAGGIAHDFNNLLTAIRGNVQLAQMFPMDDELRQCLADSEKASVRAMNLTRQLLTFAKGGQIVKNPESISEIIENTAKFIVSGTKTKCQFFFAENLKPVEIDAGQISQVIDNLIINANQAMPNGGIINIRAETISIEGKAPIPLPPGEYVKVSIADQGIGIPPQNLKKIFDPFFTTKSSGTGLGLSTTYSIIQKHGGHITVESSVGIGTIFFIYLPVAKGATLSRTGANESGTGNSYSGGGRVLIMDDQENIRILLGKMLATMNCECEFAEDGAQAMELYRKAMNSDKRFDIVFMDLTIPGGMGGKETMAELLKIDQHACAVVASGYANDSVMAGYQDYGFKGRLDKPFRMQELTDLMANLLGKRENNTAK